jgi:hypothetical protein
VDAIASRYGGAGRAEFLGDIRRRQLDKPAACKHRTKLVVVHVLRKTYIKAKDNEPVVRAQGLASVDNNNINSN